MFARKLIKNLEQWRATKDRKPLVLRGARQVGKTSLVHLFGQQFKQYIYLNLEKVEDLTLCRNYTTPRIFLQALFLEKGFDFEQEDTLIFIDEIQAYPFMIQQLRYLYEEFPQRFFIAAGSLLESVFDIDISYPVGRVHYMAVRPLSFSEFLYVSGETQTLDILEQVPIPDYAHKKILNLFHTYTLIGGMPEIIKKYVETKTVTSLSPIYADILIPYLEDIGSYAKNDTSADVLRHILKTSMGKAGERITYEGFGHSHYKSREVSQAFRLLEKSYFLKLIHPVTQVALPLLPDLKKSPRLQLLDTGVVNFYSKIQASLLEVTDLNDLYRGRITEHIVYQEMIATQESLLDYPHFWVRDKKTSQAEVDIVYPYEGKLIPIEIKSGAKGRLRSLHQFIDRCDHDIGIRLYAGQFSIENTSTTAGKPFQLVNLPYYLISKLDTYLAFYF